MKEVSPEFYFPRGPFKAVSVSNAEMVRKKERIARLKRFGEALFGGFVLLVSISSIFTMAFIVSRSIAG